MSIIGIDVSEHNGTIDWDKISDTEVAFAMIRIGYGSNYESQDDRQAVRNMQECQRLRLPYGVYLYSYALKNEDAVSEAQHLIRMVKEFNPVLGCYIDMEDADQYKRKNNLIPEKSGELLTEFCNIFMKEVWNSGYYAGTYANLYYFENVLKREKLTDAKWLAVWGPKECPVDWAEIWQYSSDGKVEGNGSGRMDMNVYLNEEHFQNLKKEFVENMGQETELPIPEQQEEEQNLTYSEGEHVTYNRIYYTSGDWTDGLKPYYTDGIITAVYKGARHPYLIGNGTGFVDDECITGRMHESSGNGENVKQDIRPGAYVRFTGKYNYNGIPVTAWFNDEGYLISEMAGDRVVLTHQGELFDAVYAKDCVRI